jgi:hypothetical protein
MGGHHWRNDCRQPDPLTRRPSTSSVVIVTNWSRTPGIHGTSGGPW